MVFWHLKSNMYDIHKNCFVKQFSNHWKLFENTARQASTVSGDRCCRMIIKFMVWINKYLSRRHLVSTRWRNTSLCKWHKWFIETKTPETVLSIYYETHLIWYRWTILFGIHNRVLNGKMKVFVISAIEPKLFRNVIGHVEKKVQVWRAVGRSHF